MIKSIYQSNDEQKTIFIINNDKYTTKRIEDDIIEFILSNDVYTLKSYDANNSTLYLSVSLDCINNKYDNTYMLHKYIECEFQSHDDQHKSYNINSACYISSHAQLNKIYCTKQFTDSYNDNVNDDDNNIKKYIPYYDTLKYNYILMTKHEWGYGYIMFDIELYHENINHLDCIDEIINHNTTMTNNTYYVHEYNYHLDNTKTYIVPDILLPNGHYMSFIKTYKNDLYAHLFIDHIPTTEHEIKTESKIKTSLFIKVNIPKKEVIKCNPMIRYGKYVNNIQYFSDKKYEMIYENNIMKKMEIIMHSIDIEILGINDIQNNKYKFTFRIRQ